LSEARSFLEGLLQRLDADDDGAERRPIPEAGPPGEHRRMCVGMASYDDPVGVWFTVQSIRLFHPEMAGRLNFLVVDNRPEGAGATHLKDLESWIPNIRYLPFRGYRSTAVRDLVFREANAEIVCCLDSHVLLAPGALAAIDRYFAEAPDSRDLLQGPLLSDALEPLATHFEPKWGAGMFGQWGLDERLAKNRGEPFEIAMQGLGLFACRREAWPGINPRFRGFGGEEGYLHEKVRRAGGRVVCHPGVGWLHRFMRPPGPPYRPSWEERLRNYLIGWSEVGWDTSGVREHFAEIFEEFGARASYESMLARALREASNPLSFFDGIFCLNLDRQLERWMAARRRHELLDIGWQVERFPAVATPENPHRGCAISFRRMIAEAKRRGYEHVLLLEDDAVFTEDTLAVVEAATRELPNLEWDLCYLGAAVWSQQFPLLPGSSVLQRCGPVTCTHAVAVHSRAYDRILEDIPPEGRDFERWLDAWVACDQYLRGRIEDETLKAVITTPRVASQPALLAYENADLADVDRYVI
jgi:hypothetical protein